MGWFAAFVAEVLYNIFRGGEKQPEYSSYGHGDYPRQKPYAPSLENSNRYYYSSNEKQRRDEERVSRRVDYSRTDVEDWHMTSDRVLQRREAYEESGVATRTYRNSKGKDVVEQKHYRVKKFEEHQMSPARTTESRGSKHRSRGQHEIVHSRDRRK